MSALWITVIGTSALAFILKYLGHSAPQQLMNNPRLKAVNEFIPVALLAALVAVQSGAHEGALTLDHRAAGLVVAAVALRIKAPYFVVVLSAAATSAAIVNLL